MAYLGRRAKGVAKVDADDAAALRVDHEVGEVAVPDAQHPVAEAQQGVGAHEVGAQGEEGLGAAAHPQERPPAHTRAREHTHTLGSASIMFTYFRRSPGTRCTTFRKLLTASARLAFLEPPTEPEGGGLLSDADTDQNRSDPRQEGLTCRRGRTAARRSCSWEQRWRARRRRLHDTFEQNKPDQTGSEPDQQGSEDGGTFGSVAPSCSARLVTEDFKRAREPDPAAVRCSSAVMVAHRNSFSVHVFSIHSMRPILSGRAHVCSEAGSLPGVGWPRPPSEAPPTWWSAG